MVKNMSSRAKNFLAITSVVGMFLLASTATGQDGEGKVERTTSGLEVSAGSARSLKIIAGYGRPGRGPRYSCAWFYAPSIVGDYNEEYMTKPVRPVNNNLYVLDCWLAASGDSLAGYPRYVWYERGKATSGEVVMTVDVAQYAVNHLNFETPKIVLSPPHQQIVGVPTWLAVTSKRHYPTVSANAGPVWASVRAKFRYVTWDMGNGSSLVTCRHDVGKVWQPKHGRSQSSRCTYTFTHDKGAPYRLRATMHWDISQRTNKNPSWHRWGTIRLSANRTVPVTQLQSAIR